MRDSQNWFLPSLLLIQSLFLGATFSSSVSTIVAFLVFAGLAHQQMRRRPKDHVFAHATKPTFGLQIRWSLLLLVTAALVSLWRGRFHFGETFNPVAFFFDAFAHTCFVMGGLFYVRRPHFGHPAMLGLGLLVVMLSAAAGASSQSLASQVTIALLASIAFLLASRLVLHAWYREQRLIRLRQAGTRTLAFRSESMSSGDSPHSDRMKIGWLFSVVMLSMFLMATSGVANVTGSILPEIQRIVHDQLKSSFDAVTQDATIGNSHYIRGSRLGSLRRHMMANPSEIALHAHSESRPGYLRGSVFDVYMNRNWDEINELAGSSDQALASFQSRQFPSSGAGTTPLKGITGRQLRRFDLAPLGDDAFATVQVENDPLKGHVFFSPLATRWVEAQGRNIHLTSHGIIEHGINARFPYVMGVGYQPLQERLDRRRRMVLTYVDESVRGPIASFASAVCAGQLTSTSKANAIKKYFQENYEYSLQAVPLPSRDDPLVHFLKTKHPAHCELFASATVLMLRTVDVPARYVTGYIADEFHTEQECWVARNRDAHAWVEAYDDVTETWFPVETTPGRVYQTLARESDTSSSLADSLNAMDENTNESSSFIAQVMGWVFSNRATDPLSLLIQLGQWPVFVLGVFLLWRRLRRGNESELSADDLKSRRMLAAVDRKLQKLSLQRAPSETLHSFANRLDQECDGQVGESVTQRSSATDDLQSYAAWYRSYAEARYQGKVPEPFSMA